jgi:hypothetical protein
MIRAANGWAETVEAVLAGQSLGFDGMSLTASSIIAAACRCCRSPGCRTGTSRRRRRDTEASRVRRSDVTAVSLPDLDIQPCRRAASTRRLRAVKGVSYGNLRVAFAMMDAASWRHVISLPSKVPLTALCRSICFHAAYRTRWDEGAAMRRISPNSCVAWLRCRGRCRCS